MERHAGCLRNELLFLEKCLVVLMMPLDRAKNVVRLCVRQFADQKKVVRHFIPSGCSLGGTHPSTCTPGGMRQMKTLDRRGDATSLSS
jgi:hypothetical protein